MKVTRFVPVFALGASLVSGASAQVYTYNRGPNRVNMSGSSCRAGDNDREQHVGHYAGTTQNHNYWTRLYCPIDRRGLEFYSDVQKDVLDSDRKVNLSALSVYVSKSTNTTGPYCYTFGLNVVTDAVYFGTGKYACSSVGGCSSPQPTWSGNATLSLNAAFSTSVPVVNWGYECEVQENDEVKFASANIVPN